MSGLNGGEDFNKIQALVGASNFKRSNPRSDRFQVNGFHHIEFYCGDATNTSARFGWGLGLKMVAKSDLSTGNPIYASYCMQSNDLTFVFTAPYAVTASPLAPATSVPHPGYDPIEAGKFILTHGFAVKAVAISVKDAHDAYTACVEGGGIGVSSPFTTTDHATGLTQTVAEVLLYQMGSVVLRFVSGDFSGPCMPNYVATEGPDVSIGLQRLDHVVGNVPVLLDQVNYLMKMTGFHEFAEFTNEDVGTVDSGLNSMVLACNNESVLLPINEPVTGTRRKSQIQTYLEHNLGPGVQHMALATNDIFKTAVELKNRAWLGGFTFMPRPSNAYYKELPTRIGDSLTHEQYKLVEELGLLVDKDIEGVLIQVFTRPVGDRPTLFLEIIQRMGCEPDKNNEKAEIKYGCGGFGKGNFRELFKSIEDYEKQLDGETVQA